MQLGYAMPTEQFDLIMNKECFLERFSKWNTIAFYIAFICVMQSYVYTWETVIFISIKIQCSEFYLQTNDMLANILYDLT